MILSLVNVIDRGLVIEKFKFKDIIKEYVFYCDRDREVKYFLGVILVYVTFVSILKKYMYSYVKVR